jgi:hypothetical protein
MKSGTVNWLFRLLPLRNGTETMFTAWPAPGLSEKTMGTVASDLEEYRQQGSLGFDFIFIQWCIHIEYL